MKHRAFFASLIAFVMGLLGCNREPKRTIWNVHNVDEHSFRLTLTGGKAVPLGDHLGTLYLTPMHGLGREVAVFEGGKWTVSEDLEPPLPGGEARDGRGEEAPGGEPPPAGDQK